jgi:hypothetical protein
LGTAPGQFGRKISDDEAGKIENLLVNEEVILDHAEHNSLREFERFKGLKWIGVICDPEDPATGEEYGVEEMAEMSESTSEAGPEKWPHLDCLRDHGPEGQCSRHWWFDGWNQRAFLGMKEKWPMTLATCLKVTAERDDEDDFWLDMLFMHRAGFAFP